MLSNRVPIAVVLLFGLGQDSFSHRQLDPVSLASQLSDPDEVRRSGALRSVLKESPQKLVPLLTRWLVHPPKVTNSYQLFASTCEILGQLRAEEAVPNLVETVELDLSGGGLNWGPELAMQTNPAIKALVYIGSPAVPALRSAYWQAGDPHKRRAILTTLMLMKEKSTEETLKFAWFQANDERELAEEGLRALGKEPPGPSPWIIQRHKTGTKGSRDLR